MATASYKLGQKIDYYGETYTVRRARREAACCYWIGPNDGRCPNTIPVGGFYVLGEPEQSVGFSRKWCVGHVDA